MMYAYEHRLRRRPVPRRRGSAGLCRLDAHPGGSCRTAERHRRPIRACCGAHRIRVERKGPVFAAAAFAVPMMCDDPRRRAPPRVGCRPAPDRLSLIFRQVPRCMSSWQWSTREALTFYFVIRRRGARPRHRSDIVDSWYEFLGRRRGPVARQLETVDDPRATRLGRAGARPPSSFQALVGTDDEPSDAFEQHLDGAHERVLLLVPLVRRVSSWRPLGCLIHVGNDVLDVRGAVASAATRRCAPRSGRAGCCGGTTS